MTSLRGKGRGGEGRGEGERNRIHHQHKPAGTGQHHPCTACPSKQRIPFALPCTRSLLQQIACISDTNPSPTPQHGGFYAFTRTADQPKTGECGSVPGRGLGNDTRPIDRGRVTETDTGYQIFTVAAKLYQQMINRTGD